MRITTTNRKNKPGAGRPSVGRTKNLPRIKGASYERLRAMAMGKGVAIAEMIERLIAGEG